MQMLCKRGFSQGSWTEGHYSRGHDTFWERWSALGMVTARCYHRSLAFDWTVGRDSAEPMKWWQRMDVNHTSHSLVSEQFVTLCKAVTLLFEKGRKTCESWAFTDGLLLFSVLISNHINWFRFSATAPVLLFIFQNTEDITLILMLPRSCKNCNVQLEMCYLINWILPVKKDPSDRDSLLCRWKVVL